MAAVTGARGGRRGDGAGRQSGACLRICKRQAGRASGRPRRVRGSPFIMSCSPAWSRCVMSNQLQPGQPGGSSSRSQYYWLSSAQHTPGRRRRTAAAAAAPAACTSKRQQQRQPACPPRHPHAHVHSDWPRGGRGCSSGRAGDALGSTVGSHPARRRLRERPKREACGPAYDLSCAHGK